MMKSPTNLFKLAKQTLSLGKVVGRSQDLLVMVLRGPKEWLEEFPLFCYVNSYSSMQVHREIFISINM